MSHNSADRTYLFVDGNYLRKRVEFAGEKIFGRALTPVWERFSLNEARKAFFYDAYPTKKQSETEEDFQRRFRAKEEEFAAISETRGWHVNFGLTRGEGKRLRQKGVDVKLALDALRHRHAGNFDRAILLAGDLDFLPLVRTLVETGAWVELWCDQRWTPRELINSADSHALIGGRAMVKYVREQGDLTLPTWQEASFGTEYPRHLIVAEGKAERHTVQVVRGDRTTFAYAQRHDVRRALRLEWHNADQLLLLVQYDYWRCSWRTF